MNILAKLVTAFRNWPVAMHFSNPALSLNPADHDYELVADWGDNGLLRGLRSVPVKKADEFTIPTLTEAQRKNEKLAELARYMECVRANIARRRKMKKRFTHLEQALRDTMKFRLEIEEGRRVFSGGLWVRVDQ